MAAVCSIALGCASRLTDAGARVRDADDYGVVRCKYLGDFAYGGTASGTGRSPGWEDRNRVRSEAAAAGATDIVWRVASSANGTAYVGAAYACPSR
ncbi:MAG: DUF4156 domain-containing protein [Polyangiaceae bacterium]|nr:DUF4156 domain-containing protein [Polyangiaceae bacterium]